MNLIHSNRKNAIFQKVRIKENFKSDSTNTKCFIIKIQICILVLILISMIFTLINYNKLKKAFLGNNKTKNKYDKDFNYIMYENNIITDKIKKYSGWLLTINEAYFLNGLIRKYKIKKCLEIGVAHGGSSVLILNSIKDIPDSILISIDLNNRVYSDPTKNTGYRVDEFFPELKKNWKLFTGDQPHKFLDQLNIKFDFVFLDTSHSTPGEIINLIEVLPFLNENAIIVIHDLLWHFSKEVKYYPANILLYPSIFGDKVPLKKKDGSIDNIGAIFLYNNQENHYLDYFLLLLNFWEFMPSDSQINDLREFIKKYYKKEIYLQIFDTAVKNNRICVDLHMKSYGNEIQSHKDYKTLNGVIHVKNYNL